MSTMRYAVIGDPISHSLSPVMQNTFFACMDLPGEMIPIHVKKKEVPAFFKFKLPFSGEDLKWCLPRYAFALVTVFSVVVMGFGMRDVLASDFDPNHKPGYKLKMEMEQKQAQLAKAQAERAAREAQEAERIKTAQEKLAARLRGAGITMIGDSVMLGASPAISEIMPDAYIDALSSRDVCEERKLPKN